MKAIIIRHGTTEANANNVFCGMMDSPLTPEGLAAAQKLRGTFPKCDAYYASRLSRAIDTLTAIFPNEEYCTLPLLYEIGLGSWEGLPKETGVDQEKRKLFKKGLYTPPGGETPEQVIARIKAFAMFLLDMYPGEETIFVVTSNGFIRTMCKMLGVKPPTGNLEHITINTHDFEKIIAYNK